MTLYEPMDYSVHGILQVRILEWVAFPLLQGIFQTQGLKPGFNPGRQVFFFFFNQLSHQGKPMSKY